MPPLLLVSQYQLTSPTSLGLGFSGHSQHAIYFLFHIISDFCRSIHAKLSSTISLFQIFWLNSKLAVLLIVCHPYRGLAVPRQASVSTAH